MMLWAFNAASAATGVLQTYFPGQFQGQLSLTLQEMGKAYLGSLTILLDDGTRIFRPMGLTDQPGGAASGGLYAILLGVGLLFTERSWIMRALAMCGMVLGLFVILLTHVRVTLVMALVGLVVIAVTFAKRGDAKGLIVLGSVAAATAVIGVSWAFAIGGDETVKRFSTLTETSPTDVYSQNRGYFLEETFNRLLFEYPLGAGAGRWGMINIYFGNADRMLYSEIMWTAWLYDGGILMMLSYAVMIATAIWMCWRFATSTANIGHLAVWGGVVLAYDVAAAAATFDSPFFATQGGMELWFLNACLLNACRTAASQHVLGRFNSGASNGERAKVPVPAPVATKPEPGE